MIRRPPRSTLSLHDALPISFASLVSPTRFARSYRSHVGEVDLTARRVIIGRQDRKSTRLNSSHSQISYAVFCLKKKNYKAHCPSDDDATHRLVYHGASRQAS